MDRSCTKLICTPCQWKHVYFFTHPCSQLITQQTFLLSMIREHLKGKFKLAFETCATLWVHLCSHQPNIHICFWFWISRSCSDAVFSKILSNLHHLIEILQSLDKTSMSVLLLCIGSPGVQCSQIGWLWWCTHEMSNRVGQVQGWMASLHT